MISEFEVWFKHSKENWNSQFVEALLTTSEKQRIKHRLQETSLAQCWGCKQRIFHLVTNTNKDQNRSNSLSSIPLTRWWVPQALKILKTSLWRGVVCRVWCQGTLAHTAVLHHLVMPSLSRDCRDLPGAPCAVGDKAAGSCTRKENTVDKASMCL